MRNKEYEPKTIPNPFNPLAAFPECASSLQIVAIFGTAGVSYFLTGLLIRKFWRPRIEPYNNPVLKKTDETLDRLERKQKRRQGPNAV